jgi:uncharacterized protein YwgA
MEDFEQGLMLAGLVTPSTAQELHERETLDEYEASETKGKKTKDNVFFKRVVLAAEIASQMHEEKTFGRIKFQKLVYLCEHIASMNLNKRYSKQAAGPFDHKFMHSIETQFLKNRWFKIEKKTAGKFTRSCFAPLENVDGHKGYFISYFKHDTEKIQELLDLFKKTTTDTTEIAATLYACMIDIKEEGSVVKEDNLLNKFYAWSDAKSRFEKEKVCEVWNWMEEEQIVPKWDK